MKEMNFSSWIYSIIYGITSMLIHRRRNIPGTTKRLSLLFSDEGSYIDSPFF